MRVLVADASALLEYLLGTDLAGTLGDVLRDAETDVHVPALCDVEVAAGLRRALLHRSMGAQRAGEALADYLDLPLTRHGHQSLMARMLALRPNFSAYDATYVALAEHVGAELLTADDRLARAVRTHTGITVLP